MFRQVTAAIAFFLLALVLSCADTKEKKAAQYIESARQFIAQRKPETALIEYQNALKLDPDNDTALFELAETYVVMNKLESAIRYYTMAAQADPQKIESRLRLAQVFTRTDRLMEAREQVAKAMKIVPDSVNGLHILSGIQIRERDLDAAIDTLKQAEAIEPDNVRTQLALASLYTKTRSLPEAKAAFAKAFSLDPKSRDAYMGLAKLLAAQKQWDKAESFLLSVVETPGILALKYNDLAWFYEQRGQADQAEHYYKESIASARDATLPRLALARFYTRNNRKQEALAILEKGMETRGRSPLLLTGLSKLYLHFKVLDQALATVDEALAADRNNVDALFQKGRVLMAQKDYKQALDLFDQVLRFNRFHPKAYYFRALCIRERGATDRPEQRLYRAAAGMLDDPESFERAQVRENLEAAVTVNPGFVEARLALATHYLLDKETAKAREQISEILTRQAPDHRIMTLVAGADLLEGKVKEAETILLTINRENPEYLPAAIRLGYFYKDRNQIPKALSFFKQAYAQEPRAVGLVDEMVRLYTGQGDIAGAMAMVQQYKKTADDKMMPFFYTLEGELLLTSDREKEALDCFRDAIATAPGYSRPRMNLARYWADKGRKEKALAQYQAVLTTEPKLLSALLGAALAHDSLGQYSDAETGYRKVLAINERHPVAANNLAFLLAEKSSTLEEAFKLARVAREVAPDNPSVMDTLGWIYYQKGSFFNALSEFEESLEKDPDNALTHFHYGMTLYMTKSYEKARTHMKRALELDPGFRGAQKAREMIN